jgi:hypothetical protein
VNQAALAQQFQQSLVVQKLVAQGLNNILDALPMLPEAKKGERTEFADLNIMNTLR